jgi:hypothetical protein
MAGNLQDRAKQQRSFLEKLGGWIPGYGGYADRERRREVDRLEREFVAGKIVAQKTGVKRLVDELMSAGRYDGLAVYDKIMNKVDKVANKIKAAPYGWSGMFDSVKIDEAALDKLYQYDCGLVEGAQELALAVAELSGLGSNPSAAQAKANTILELLDRIDDYFSRRTELVSRG